MSGLIRDYPGGSAQLHRLILDRDEDHDGDDDHNGDDDHDGDDQMNCSATALICPQSDLNIWIPSPKD